MLLQLPRDLWPTMQINYTLTIEDTRSETVIEIGPFPHVGGSRVVSHTISDGIQRESNYSIRVTVSSVAGVSKSSAYYFGKWILI